MKNKNYLTHSTTHYLLAIHKLSEANKRTRYVDIANHVGVAKSSMSVAVKRLKDNQLVDEDKNKNLFLTEKGHQDVHNTLANRTLFYYFLTDVLGVEENNAKTDACNTEHILGEDTQQKLFSFLKKISSPDKNKAFKVKKSAFSFEDFKTLKAFKKSQLGDTHLL